MLLLAGAIGRLAAKEPLAPVLPPAAAADAPSAHSVPARNVEPPRLPEPGTPKNIADLKELERRVQKTVAKVSPSVVFVDGGSGVVVSRDGYVLTVAHVGERAGRDVWVLFSDGRRARAVTLGNDHGVDAGMVKITEPGEWPHVTMGRSRELKSGQWCLAMGYPLSFERGKQSAVRIGRVLRRSDTMITTDCTIMGGDSGGPLFDLDGRLIGIGSRCDDRVTNNFSVPIDCFREHWEPLSKGEDFNSLAPKRAFLGVGPSEDREVARLGVVESGGAADKAGLKAGDVVLKFGGEEVRGYDDLPPLVRRRKPNEQVEIVVRRGEQTLTIKATLGQRFAE
jgi:serine protease Do